MVIKIEVEELDDLQMKAMEMNLASTAMLDLIQAIKLKNKIINKDVPDFWNELYIEKEDIRINKQK